MERATQYNPSRVSHPVESLREFFEAHGILIQESFWRKRIDDYVASVVQPALLDAAATENTASEIGKFLKDRIRVHEEKLSSGYRYKNALVSRIDECETILGEVERAAKTSTV